MNSFSSAPWRAVVVGAACFAGFSAMVMAQAPSKAPGKSKAGAKASGKGKTANSGSEVVTVYDKHLAANLKFLNVLSRYAECLGSAKDATTAAVALDKIDLITRDAITAGEELVKLGRPVAVLEAKLSRDADLQLTSQLVAEKTRVAVKSISENDDVKTLLAPAVENFQAALNRIQQAAEDPQGPVGGAPEEKPAAGNAAGKSPDPGSLPAQPAGDTAAAPSPR